jgi:hypothetical protein
VPDLKPGEGKDFPDDQNPDVTALAAEVREIRPGWEPESIHSVLTDQAAVRPWPLVRAAMLAVARDPESRYPGRLACNGPWWEQAARTAGAGITRLPALVSPHPYDPDPETGRDCRHCNFQESNRCHEPGKMLNDRWEAVPA